MQIGTYSFTKDQYDEIISLLKNKPDIELLIIAAGTCIILLASNSTQEWIIDTGATNHIVADKKLLDSSTITQIKQPRKVFSPNGEALLVIHIGSSTLSDRITISNVLHLPQFQYNIMSVSKVTRELKC